MQAFTVRDLREHTGELIRGAEGGGLAIVTKHGRPVFLAVPLDDLLLAYGVHTAIAIDLFRDGIVTLPKAAKIANMAVEAFMEKLVGLNIPTVDYPPDDLDEELANIG